MDVQSIRQRVESALRRVRPTGADQDVVSLGLVGDVQVNEAGAVSVLLGLRPADDASLADTVGLVIERKRGSDEKDGFMWFCENCNEKLYEEYFHLRNIETELKPVFDRFYADESLRTCGACGNILKPPAA